MDVAQQHLESTAWSADKVFVLVRSLGELAVMILGADGRPAASRLALGGADESKHSVRC